MTPLTWDELLKECSRLHSDPPGSEQMLDVMIMPIIPEGLVGTGDEGLPMKATVVPTRMHEPGFYVRSVNRTPIWAYWVLRADDDMDMFQRFVELGRVRRLREDE